MSKIDIIIDRLAGVRSTPARPGVSRAWRACCPAHQPEGPRAGRSPALSVAESNDGAVLLHCFAGCEAGEIAGALGLELADLFPGGEGRGIAGGPAGWLSVAALLDRAEHAVSLAAAGGSWWDALDAVGAAKSAARAAARADARGGCR